MLNYQSASIHTKLNLVFNQTKRQIFMVIHVVTATLHVECNPHIVS